MCVYTPSISHSTQSANAFGLSVPIPKIRYTTANTTLPIDVCSNHHLISFDCSE